MELKDIMYNMEKMVKYQDSLNNQIVPGWKDVNNPFYRGVWVEAGELMNELDWEWWGKKEENRIKIIGEVVDIWHFLLSWLIKEGVSSSGLAVAFTMQNSYKPKDVYTAIDLLAESALRELPVESLNNFVIICKLLKIDFNTLVKNYIAKNVLNKFRQDRGLQSGRYNKVWGGKKDSEWVSIIAESIALDDFDCFREKLYLALEEKYMEYYYTPDKL